MAEKSSRKGQFIRNSGLPPNKISCFWSQFSQNWTQLFAEKSTSLLKIALYFILSNFDKLSLILHGPEDALVWLDAFAAKCRVKRRQTLQPSADFQITNQFLFHCGVESLKKLKSIVQNRNEAASNFPTQLREAAQNCEFVRPAES